MNLSKAAFIRLMNSVDNGAGSLEGWAESCHNNSHSFSLKGQLCQIEALRQEPNLDKWKNPCNSRSEHFRSCSTSWGIYCDFRAETVAGKLAKCILYWFGFLCSRRTSAISSLKNSQKITAGCSLALLNMICKCFSTRALLSQRKSYEYYSVMWEQVAERRWGEKKWKEEEKEKGRLCCPMMKGLID